MKKVIRFVPVLSATAMVALLIFLLLLPGCTNTTPEVMPTEEKAEAVSNSETIWHVKAIHPQGRSLDVKAFDQEGNQYDVKAIQNADQRHLLDIKALMDGGKLPVKVLVSTDEYAPVKAIGPDGAIYDIKALTPEGDKLDVKGVSRAGNIIDIKTVSKEGTFYGVKAISPEGQWNDVKGVKLTRDNQEATVNGVAVHAHVKALPQNGCFGDHAIWHIKAIHPEGRTLDVKALDKEGKVYDVKAIQDTDQKHFMDIKALVGEEKLPVKILVSDDDYAPIKAIGPDGTIYDVKAITPEGDKLDVKGVSRTGNIIDIKAINKAGAFYGIKAISPEGQLNDVKGIKMSQEDQEATVNGVAVHAHIKALPQIN